MEGGCRSGARATSTASDQFLMPNKTDLLAWLYRRALEAEQTLVIREGMAKTCRTGTNAEWHSAAQMHPSTAGMRSKKSDRLKEAAGHDRIAVKLRHELGMFKATIHAIQEFRP